MPIFCFSCVDAGPIHAYTTELFLWFSNVIYILETVNIYAQAHTHTHALNIFKYHQQTEQLHDKNLVVQCRRFVRMEGLDKTCLSSQAWGFQSYYLTG